MRVIAVIERPAVIRQIRSAEPFDLLRAVSPVERLATKPPGQEDPHFYGSEGANSFQNSSWEIALP